MKKICFTILSFCCLLSCNQENDIDLTPYDPKIVVEGSIEEGGYSSVLLSISASMTGPKDTLSLLNNVIRSAKVIVSDGTNSEILSLHTNDNKIPPYEYRGSQLKGETGKDYTLTIEYRGEKITATTYIPEPVAIDAVWFKKDHPNDTTGYISISFKNTTTDYYQISTRVVSKEKVFTPCLYGNLDSRLYRPNEQVSIQINKGPVLFPETTYRTDFNVSYPVWVKLSTVPKETYKFWTSYQNEILNTQNPIFPANTSLISNIKGGIGIWSGYGSKVQYFDPQSNSGP